MAQDQCNVGACPGVDQCSPNPCQHGGTCSTGVYSHTCDCPAGISGDNCETNVDYCSPNPCQHGGTCSNGVNSHTCDCHAGFSGDNCETIDYCYYGPCLNGGTCSNGVNSPICDCPAGISGDTCETIDYCYFDPCQHGETCSNGVNSPICDCPAGFSGGKCETIDYCSSNTCQNQGTCTNATCDCPAGISGDTCETIDYCYFDPCQHGGTCSNGVNSYICDCPAGFSGGKCETTCHDNIQHMQCNVGACPVNECNNEGAGHNCDANAECTNTYGSFTCACNAGYSGDGVTCTAVSCPTNSNGADVPSGCTCNAGYNGVVTATTTAPYYSSTCAGGLLNLKKSAYTYKEDIVFQFRREAGATATDWIAVYPRSVTAPDSRDEATLWFYVCKSQKACKSPVSSGTIKLGGRGSDWPLAKPLAQDTYNLWYFAEDSYTPVVKTPASPVPFQVRRRLLFGAAGDESAAANCNPNVLLLVTACLAFVLAMRP